MGTNRSHKPSKKCFLSMNFDLIELAKKADRVMAKDKITKRSGLSCQKYDQTEAKLREVEHLPQKVKKLMNNEKSQTAFAYDYPSTILLAINTSRMTLYP